MAATDWRAAVEERRRRPLAAWLWGIAAMTFGVLVVGGITRLTLSGLSIVDWKPLMGVIPPLNEAQWQAVFDQYRQFPDYQTWRQGMSLSEFKFIYFWEYLHRLLARGIGLVFLVPFVVFWLRGWLKQPLLGRTVVLFGLGAAQGLLGWLMVQSGLVDRPSVSHFRLAAHLSLAFLIFGGAVWLARDVVLRERAAIDGAARGFMLRALTWIGVVLGTQVVWGAFVAGLRAGRYFPTFPLMGGRLVPPEVLQFEGLAHNLISNPIAVQWVHRLVGTLLLLLVVGVYVRMRSRVSDATSRRYGAALAGGIVVQYGLGIATLLLHVPVSLGVIHQAVAMVLFGIWLAWLHRVVHAVPVGAGERASGRPADGAAVAATTAGPA